MERTIRLFDEDSFLSEFSATVIYCEPIGNDFSIVLDKTAFFPEGGGQTSDTGIIEGAKVTAVTEKCGIIYHRVSAGFKIGTTVNCKIDFDARFDKMQNHSGEHIVSGLICNKFGFNNVGFHLGAEDVTLDFNGVLTAKDLLEIERLANNVVYENIEIKTEYPSNEVLSTLNYRSKLELTENIRIVTIGKYDICACCAPHVKYTGQIGAVRFTGFEKYKGGTRLTIACGNRALKHFNMLKSNVQKISALLCAKQCETACAVADLIAERDKLKYNIAALIKEKCNNTVQGIMKSENPLLLIESGLDFTEMRLIANGAKEKVPFCLIISPESTGGKYLCASNIYACNSIAASLNKAFCGKGGGTKLMAQGNLQSGSKKEFEEYFNNLLTSIDNMV